MTTSESGLRPGRRAALAAAVGCAVYGTLKLYWALGGDFLLREAPLSADQRRDLLERTPGTMVTLNWGSVALSAIGVALALATVHEGRQPRLLVVWVPALIAGFMLLRAASGAAGDIAILAGAADGETHIARWDLVLWAPYFAVWGTAWALAARAAHRRTAGRPPRPARHRHVHLPPAVR